MGTWYEDIVTVIRDKGGIATLSDIYNGVRAIRTEPSCKSEKSFRNTICGFIYSYSSDAVSEWSGKDLFYSVSGLGKGVWGLREMDQPVPRSIDINVDEGNEKPSRVVHEVSRIIRDTGLSRRLKILHRNRCQICNETVRVGGGKDYSEAHHIRPLGVPHNGPDVPSNIIVVCPNHHVQLDYGGLELTGIRQHPNHTIDREYMNYYNDVIVR